MTGETAVPKEFRSTLFFAGNPVSVFGREAATEHARWASDTPKRRAESTERLRKMSKPV